MGGREREEERVRELEVGLGVREKDMHDESSGAGSAQSSELWVVECEKLWDGSVLWDGCSCCERSRRHYCCRILLALPRMWWAGWTEGC